MSTRRPASETSTRWNHNIAVQQVLLDALPAEPGRVLDVGCGDGVLTEALAERCDEVVAIDVDADCVARTREAVRDDPSVTVVEGDLMAAELAPASFDAVLAVASLHHLELRPGLARLASLVAPGGLLGVVGLARTRTGWDLAHDAVGVVSSRVRRRRHGMWEHGAPIARPAESYTEVLRTASLLLPGVRYRRHTLFRYTLLWTRPDDWSPPVASGARRPSR